MEAADAAARSLDLVAARKQAAFGNSSSTSDMLHMLRAESAESHARAAWHCRELGIVRLVPRGECACQQPCSESFQVEATEKLSKGISDFPQAQDLEPERHDDTRTRFCQSQAGEAISVATSVANRSAALEEGASKARWHGATGGSAKTAHAKKLSGADSRSPPTICRARLRGEGM